MRDRLRSLLAKGAGTLSRTGTNGPAPLREMTALLLGNMDDRRFVRTRHGEFSVRVSNPLERWRVDTLLSKEPETIAWLDDTITPQSVFYDVGANVGLYTLYACHIHSGVRAVCFEPESLNFARLNRNLNDNGLSDRALALSIGLGAGTGLSAFRLSALEAGRALHGDRFVAAGTEAHRQGIVVLPLDLARQWAGEAMLPPPTHLKIDVDGPELDVLAGAEATLSSASLRHVLVEVAPDQFDAATACLTGHGFELVGRGADAADGTNLVFRRG